MNVGMGKAIIQLDKSVYLAGFAAKRKFDGYLDQVYVQTLLFDDGEKLSGFVSYDLCAVDHLIIDKVKDQLKDYDLRCVTFCATHTHSSFASNIDTDGILNYTKMAFFDQDDYVIDAIVTKSVECITEALNNMSQGKISSSHDTLLDVGSNRNSTEFKGDNSLDVYVVKNLTKQALMINYACHPTVLPVSNLKVSGDFVAYYRDLVLEDYDVSIFLQGACGDISTRYTRKSSDYNEIIRSGSVLHDKVMNNINDNFSDISINFHSFIVKMECKKKLTEEECQKAELDARKEYNKINEEDVIRKRQAEVKIQGASASSYYSKYSIGIESVDFNIFVYNINDEYFITVPGELFSELIQDFDHDKVHIIGYANGYYTYLADEYAYDNNYYEACLSPFKKGEPEKLVKEIKKHIKL